MAYETIRYEEKDGVGTLTIAREKALNAINRAVIDELFACLSELRSSRTLHALILTGAGEKAFVAGADIVEMQAMTADEAERFSIAGHAAFGALETLAVPTIAAINGFALGGGLELAMACDLLYASSKAKFGQPEVNLGVTPGFGGTQRLTRRVGIMRAKELLFTGEIVDAARARELGLVLEVFEPAALMEHCRKLAVGLAAKSRSALARAKEAVEFGADRLLAEANREESRIFGSVFGTADQREGMAAFLAKRPAKFES